ADSATTPAVPLDTRRSYTLRRVAEKGAEWFEFSCSTSRSRTPPGTSGMPTSAARCRAGPSATARSSARRRASRSSRITPSGSSRTWTPSSQQLGRRSSRPPGRTRWTWAFRSTSTLPSWMAEPDYPRPVSPGELGFQRIVYEKSPPRATITLNRPEVLNAFDFQMLRELARACEDVSWDDEIRVVVLTGAGRAFCVGADLATWAEDYVGRPTGYWKWFGAFKDAHARVREIGKPTLARINGIAVGGGNELQMACDLAVMVD